MGKRISLTVVMTIAMTMFLASCVTNTDIVSEEDGRPARVGHVNADGKFANEIDFSNLLTTEIGGTTVYYPEGYDNNGLDYIEAFNDMVAFYSEELKIEGVNFSVAFVTRDNFVYEAQKSTYGVPFMYDDIIVLGATNDNSVVESSLPFLEQSSDIAFELFEKSGMSAEAAVEAFPIILGMHELGHKVAKAYELTGMDKATNEMIGSLMTVTYLNARQPELAAIYKGNSYVHAYPEGVTPTYYRYKDFFEGKVIPVPSEKLPDAIAAYDWYQKQLVLVDFEAVETQGIGFVKGFKETYGMEELDYESLVTYIATLTPALDNWIAKMDLKYGSVK